MRFVLVVILASLLACKTEEGTLKRQGSQATPGASERRGQQTGDSVKGDDGLDGGAGGGTDGASAGGTGSGGGKVSGGSVDTQPATGASPSLGQWIGDTSFSAGSAARLPPGALDQGAVEGTTIVSPEQTLTVDWGAVVAFKWDVGNVASAELVWIHTRTSTAKRFPVTTLPQGELSVSTQELQAGPYIVSLATRNAKDKMVEYPLHVHVLPVITLASSDATVTATRGKDFPLDVTVGAGADRAEVYLNGASEAVITLDSVAAGAHAATFKPSRAGDNLLRGFAWRHGLRSRPARLALAVVGSGEDVDCQPGTTDGDGSSTGSGKDDGGKGDGGKGDGGKSDGGKGDGGTGDSGKGDGGKADGGKDASDCEPTDDEEPQPPLPPPPPPAEPRLGAHLVNSFPGSCSMLEMRGDSSSTARVAGANCKGPGNLRVLHDWYAARDFGLPATTVLGAVKSAHKGPPLPIDVTGDGKADFPTLDFEALKGKVSGTLKASAVAVSSWQSDLSPAESIVGMAQRNVVVVGSKGDPIRIDGDVLVIGDLVLKGWVQGIGTIYVTGNVFFPSDVFNIKTAYPFSADKAVASQQGKVRLAGSDGLGVVAQGHVFAGDAYPLHGNPALNPHVQAMYGWIAGGKNGYEKLYELPYDCQSGTYATLSKSKHGTCDCEAAGGFGKHGKSKHDTCDCRSHGGFSLIEASLYAKGGIYGSSGAWLSATKSVANSFAINGTVVASAFDVQTTPELCVTPSQPHPVHGYPQGRSYVMLDWRLLHGLEVFSQLAPLYELP
jgi:hypothetical protein